MKNVITQTKTGVRAAHLLCATAMYGTLGKLMYKYRTNPVILEEFWDMSLLRGTSTGFSTDVVVPNTGLPVPVPMSDAVRSSITADTAIVLKNNSATALTLMVSFYDSTGATTVPVEIEQDQALELSALELGWSTTRIYLNVLNSGAAAGNLHVEIE